MFVKKTDKEIGNYLRKKIINKYGNVRQFCIHYLAKQNSALKDEPSEIRNLCNRFSQILNGNKSLQLYDLPYVTYLLGTSCEDILSCGMKNVPITIRLNNYNVSHSKNKKDWDEYLSNELNISYYADEYGKTIIDYAIEFKNYDLIKYLIDKEYISFVKNDQRYYNHLEFGADTTFKPRPNDHPTINYEFHFNKKLRTEVLSLAIINNDLTTLKRFKYKELPVQYDLNVFNPIISFTEYYDELFIDAIASSNENIFGEILVNYKTKIMNDKYEVTWLYPFLCEIAVVCIQKNLIERAEEALETVLNHNKHVFSEMRKQFLSSAKALKDSGLYKWEHAISRISDYYNLNKDKNIVSFAPLLPHSIEPVAFNIFMVDYSTNSKTINDLIANINETYNQILEIPSSFLKQE